MAHPCRQLLANAVIAVSRVGSYPNVELEEAARVTGASPARALRDVTVPLIRFGLMSSWLLCFMIFVREYRDKRRPCEGVLSHFLCEVREL